MLMRMGRGWRVYVVGIGLGLVQIPVRGRKEVVHPIRVGLSPPRRQLLLWVVVHLLHPKSHLSLEDQQLNQYHLLMRPSWYLLYNRTNITNINHMNMTMINLPSHHNPTSCQVLHTSIRWRLQPVYQRRVTYRIVRFLHYRCHTNSQVLIIIVRVVDTRKVTR